MKEIIVFKIKKIQKANSVKTADSLLSTQFTPLTSWKPGLHLHTKPLAEDGDSKQN